MVTKLYSLKEEIMNSISHGLGVLITIGLTMPLIVKAVIHGDMYKMTAFLIYMICVGGMFLASTLYHAITNDKAKRVLRLVDHCSIFLCIAGTYTPILLLGLDRMTNLVVLPIIWILAVVGITIKIVSFVKGDFAKLEIPSLVLYLAMGWISVFLSGKMIRDIGVPFFAFLVAGGLLYSVGVYFYKNRKIKFNHGIWHIFILVASISIYTGIAIYLG